MTVVDDLVTQLGQRIDAPAARYHKLDLYSSGRQPLAFLSPEARKSLGNRLSSVNANVCRLLVESVAERLRVTGMSDPTAWQAWTRNDMGEQSHIAHREALTLGDSFVMVWAGTDGRAQATVESAKECAVITDPGSRQVTAGMKRWNTDKTTEATLLLPDRIVRLRANSTGATVAGFQVIGELPNPLGVPPIVRLRNGGRLSIIDPEGWHDAGVSEMWDLLPLQDALSKLLSDLMVSSEYGARPRRWATGLELVEEPVLDDDGNPVLDDNGEPVIDAANPIGETDRMMVNESPEGKFGQLTSSDLAGYDAAINIIMRSISAVSGLPEHLLGIGGDNPTSADSIRASEAALTARAEARQQTFGKAWEQAARLMVAVENGTDPAAVDVRVQWADPSTRSAAQEADAVTKLVQAGVLPVSYALRKLGYSDDDIEAIRTARRADALDQAGTNLTALIP